ncbi:MAG: hypothetical protein GY801_28685 [bacterium]|nr:hypothetical protein [bacterium]
MRICKTNNIAMLMSFHIPTEENPDLECSTALLSDEYNPPYRMKKAFDSIIEKNSSHGMMITTRNEQGQVVNMTAVV